MIPLNQYLIGDAIEVMKEMPDKSVDIVFTSPPYNIGLKYAAFDDNLTEEEHKNFSASWLKETYRVMSDGGRMYVILSDKMLWWFKPLAESINFKYCQMLVWCKPNMAAIMGGKRITGDWNYMIEPILLFRKGKRNPMLSSKEFFTRTFNWFVETTPQSNFKEGKIHPAQFSVPLCAKILSRTPGDIVLDPFAGSASVAVACEKLNRKWICIDIDPSYKENALKRIGQMGLGI